MKFNNIISIFIFLKQYSEAIFFFELTYTPDNIESWKFQLNIRFGKYVYRKFIYLFLSTWTFNISNCMQIPLFTRSIKCVDILLLSLQIQKLFKTYNFIENLLIQFLIGVHSESSCPTIGMTLIDRPRKKNSFKYMFHGVFFELILNKFHVHVQAIQKFFGRSGQGNLIEYLVSKLSRLLFFSFKNY